MLQLPAALFKINKLSYWKQSDWDTTFMVNVFQNLSILEKIIGNNPTELYENPFP